MEIISSLKKDPIQKPALKPSTLNPSEKDPLSSFSRLSINGKETLKPPQIEYRLSVQSNRNSAYEQNLAKLANEFQNEFGSEAVLDVVPSLVVNSARCSVPGPSDGPTLVVPPLSEPIHAVQPLPLSESNPVAVQTLLESNPLPKTAEPLSPTKSQPDPAQQTITNFAQNLQKSPSLLRIFVSTTHGLPSTQQADILHHGAKLESKILELMTLYNTFINELGTPKLT
jgi:hypothetical protein